MNLRTYLDEHRIGIPQFAPRIGVSVQALHRYLLGERIPRPEVLEQISLATNGAVQPNDFYAFSQVTEHPAPEVAA
jgi:transcriptional regulator with XRE-family HTH domain